MATKKVAKKSVGRPAGKTLKRVGNSAKSGKPGSVDEAPVIVDTRKVSDFSILRELVGPDNITARGERVIRWARKPKRTKAELTQVVANLYSLARDQRAVIRHLLEDRDEAISDRDYFGKVLHEEGRRRAELGRDVAARIARSRKKMEVKNDRDPKQAAKKEVRKWFFKWKRDRSMMFRSDADFARHVVKNTCIQDTNTVYRWIRREWRKEL